MKKLTALFLCAIFLCVCLAGCGANDTSPSNEQGEETQQTEVSGEEDFPYLCTALRSLSNPYHQQVIQGMELYAKAQGIPEDKCLVITHDNNTEKLLNDMRTLIAKYDGNIVFSVDPNQKSDLISIAELCEENKVYWASIWERPDEVKVSDYDYWVTAVNFSNFESGYLSAKALFESMGGKGKVWFLDGTTGHAATISRREGADKALEEFPDIELVGYEDCSWEKTKGYNSANNAISANPDLGGIWAANDNMAMGALEAIRAKNLVGKIKLAGVNAIPDMVQAISKGEAVATISTDPLWQGGITLAMCVDAKMGKYDVASVDEDYRYWLAKVDLIDQNNVQSYIDDYLNGSPEYDYSDYYAGKYISGAEGNQ